MTGQHAETMTPNAFVTAPGQEVFRSPRIGRVTNRDQALGKAGLHTEPPISLPVLSVLGVFSDLRPEPPVKIWRHIPPAGEN